MIKRKISRLTKLLHISAGLSLFLASQFVFSTPRQVYATPPPLVACSAEQARATERWWYFGGRGVIDFGASGTASTLSVNPQNISILTAKNTRVIFDVLYTTLKSTKGPAIS